MEKTLGDEEVSFLPPLLGYSFHRSLRVDSSGNIPRITKNKTDRADLRFLYSSTGSFDIPNACILFYTCVIIIISTAIKLLLSNTFPLVSLNCAKLLTYARASSGTDEEVVV